MHDRTGKPLQKGDKVTISAIITAVMDKVETE